MKLQRKNRGSGGEARGKCFGILDSVRKKTCALNKKEVLRAKDYRRAKRGPRKKLGVRGRSPRRHFRFNFSALRDTEGLEVKPQENFTVFELEIKHNYIKMLK